MWPPWRTAGWPQPGPWRWAWSVWLGLVQVVISIILFVSRNCGAALGRVIDCVLHQRQDVLVGERVVDVLGFAPPPDQPRRMERLQTRRYGGDLFTLVFGQLGNAGFTLGEPHQEAQPLGVAERPKNRRPGLDLRPRRQANRRARRMPAMHGISVNDGFHYIVPSIHGIIGMGRVGYKAQGLNHDGTNGTEIKIALTL